MAFLLGAGKGLSWGMFQQKLGLGDEPVEVQAVEPDDLERLKEEAEEIAQRAITGYLTAKKKRADRLAVQAAADKKKRKGPEPEELREHLRAIRQSQREQESGSR